MAENLGTELANIKENMAHIQANDRLDRDILLVLRIKLENIEHLVEELKEQHDADTESNRKAIADLRRELEAKAEAQFVKKEAFAPIKSVVYGIAGTVLFAVLMAVMKVVKLG